MFPAHDAAQLMCKILNLRCYGAGVQIDTSPIAQGYIKLFWAIRIFAFVARLAIRKD